MRKSALWVAVLVLVVSSAPATFAQIADPCRAWTCVYEFSGAEGEEPVVRCEEVGMSRGQWVSCNVTRQCMWVVTDTGRQRQCSPAECRGEYCMWV
jgi:hypothetical protein